MDSSRAVVDVVVVGELCEGVKMLTLLSTRVILMPLWRLRSSNPVQASGNDDRILTLVEEWAQVGASSSSSQAHAATCLLAASLMET